MLAGVVIAATCANAADMYAYGGLKDGPAATILPWAGFYAGINGGGSFGASENLVVTNNVDPSQADIGQFYRHAGFGGGQLGYNFGSFGRNFVFGLETDLQGSGIDSGFTRTLNYEGAPATFNASQVIDYFGTVRGRIGYAVDGVLIYATGGFAYADVQTKVSISSSYKSGFTNSLSGDEVETGYAVGAGLEYALNPVWSVKAEYQYIDLGDQTVTGERVGLTGVDSMRTDNNFHTVRIGLNYHINDYAPLK
jgi:outer membrane immunogenic protein